MEEVRETIRYCIRFQFIEDQTIKSNTSAWLRILNEGNDRAINFTEREILRQRGNKFRLVGGKREGKRAIRQVVLRQFEREEFTIRAILRETIRRTARREIGNTPTGSRLRLKMPSDAQIENIVQRRISALRRSLPRTTAERVFNSFDSSIKRGLRKDDIVRLVREDIKRQTRQRSFLVSTTETTGTNNEIVIQALENEGVKYKKWITRDDARVRRAHMRINNDVKRVNQPFIIRYGDRVLKLQYPQEPRCRCRVVGARRPRRS